MTQRAVELSYAGWIHEAASSLEETPPDEIIDWSLRVFGEGLTIATGFGAEGMALIDMVSKRSKQADIFFLDTGFLFDETYELRRRVEERYGIRIRASLPDLSPEEQAAQYGDELWVRDPDLCCRIRKLEPLRQALDGRDAWMTAIRRDQTDARRDARVVEWDFKWNLVKLNPLARWSREDVWSYIRVNNVPYNPLHERGYPSIGCHPCTRPVRPGEDERAGRWPGRAKTECGLHDRLPGESVTAFRLPAAPASVDSWGLIKPHRTQGCAERDATLSTD
jgi:phosphoadenosine phosphosulfate reductase